VDENIFYALQIASTLSVLLPLSYATFSRKSYDFATRVFLFYLMLGFFVDMGGWYFYVTRNGIGNSNLRYAYDLAEAMLLFLLIYLFSSNPFQKKLLRIGIFLLVPFWAARFWILETAGAFKSVTQLVTAVICAFLILKHVEMQTRPLRNLRSWILIGIFFYTFSTFFFASVLISHLGNIWYAYNILNIVTNCIFLAGFIIAKQR
jgi:hypothetical protein